MKRHTLYDFTCMQKMDTHKEKHPSDCLRLRMDGFSCVNILKINETTTQYPFHEWILWSMSQISGKLTFCFLFVCCFILLRQSITLQSRLALNSWQHPYINLPNSGTVGVTRTLALWVLSMMFLIFLKNIMEDKQNKK